MNRFPVLLLPLILLMTACDEETIPDMLLTNSDMEERGLYSNEWFVYRTNGEYITEWSTDFSYSPTHSLKLTKYVADPGNTCAFGQTYSGPVPVGKELTLTAMIKGVDLTGTGVGISIQTEDGSTNLQYISSRGEQTINGTFDWTQYSVTLSPVAVGTKSITVHLTLLQNSMGTVYFDDVTLTHK